MAAVTELQSFLFKLVQLNRNGINGNLNINSVNGKFYVSLQAELDSLLTYPSYNSAHFEPRVIPERSKKPSRIRRRQRRREAREANQNEAAQLSTNSSSDCDVETDVPQLTPKSHETEMVSECTSVDPIQSEIPFTLGKASSAADVDPFQQLYTELEATDKRREEKRNAMMESYIDSLSKSLFSKFKPKEDDQE